MSPLCSPEATESHDLPLAVGELQARVLFLHDRGPRRLMRRVPRQSRRAVERLSKAIELHDFSTGEHVDRMAKVAAFLEMELGLDAERVLLLTGCGSDARRRQRSPPGRDPWLAGPLTPSGATAMQRHAVVGHEARRLQSELLASRRQSR